MHIILITVGRLKEGPLAQLYQLYAKRLAWKLTLHEIDIKAPEVSVRLKKEADAIEALIPKGSSVILLDEKGTQYTSAAFASFIETTAQHQGSTLCFVLGSADGFYPGLKDRASHKIALGLMTWPHLLARVLLVEQLYRAQQILSGHPYHRE